MEGCREDEEGDEDGTRGRKSHEVIGAFDVGHLLVLLLLITLHSFFLFEDIYYFVGFIFDNVSSSHLFICLSEINYFQVTKIKYTFLIIRQIFVLSTNALLFVSL